MIFVLAFQPDLQSVNRANPMNSSADSSPFESVVFGCILHGRELLAIRQTDDRFAKALGRFPVSAMFGLPMVDNYLPFLSSAPTEDEVKEILANSNEIINGIISSIAHRESGNLNVYEGKGSKQISIFAGKGYAKHRPTADFNVNDSCVGCGLCEKICPTASIKVIDGVAQWTEENCDLCFGCLHRCPNEAINFKNKTQGKGRYTNPYTEI